MERSPSDTAPRPEVTERVTRGAARLLLDMGFAPLLEVTLPNGRRADIMALGPKGEVLIAEIKSGPDDFRTDLKWGEYGDFCDQFYFAVSDAFPTALIPGHAGLIVADAFGGAVVRPSPETPIAPARRKAVTLAFARLAAVRAVLAPKPQVR